MITYICVESSPNELSVIVEVDSAAVDEAQLLRISSADLVAVEESLFFSMVDADSVALVEWLVTEL